MTTQIVVSARILDAVVAEITFAGDKNVTTFSGLCEGVKKSIGLSWQLLSQAVFLYFGNAVFAAAEELF